MLKVVCGDGRTRRRKVSICSVVVVSVLVSFIYVTHKPLARVAGLGSPTPLAVAKWVRTPALTARL